MANWKKPTAEEISDNRKRLRERADNGDLKLPEAVLEIRKTFGFTQEKLATFTGVTKRQISEIETGKANPTVETLNKIGKLFGFSVGFVVTDKSTSRPRPPKNDSIADNREER